MLRQGLRTGEWHRVAHNVFVEGSEPPTVLDRALGLVVVTNGAASHSLAGVLHNLDGVGLKPPFVTVEASSRSSRHELHRRDLAHDLIVEVSGFPCTNGLRTMLDLAQVLDDVSWEQALESALRQRLTTVAELETVLPALAASKTPGIQRVRRVLRKRCANAPPTESLLETLTVQLIRSETRLPEPVRQVEIFSQHDAFIARVDLAWPDDGVFIELDGQHHKDQPVYDSTRETAIVAATSWLPGRFTWTEVVNYPNATRRRLVDLLDAARFRRPLSPTRSGQKSA